jgi:hypothetical protein
MRINKYNTFLLKKIFESVVSSSSEFRDIIKTTSNDDSISEILYHILFNGKDIKTNYNAIDASKDKNDEVTFIPDTQFQRFLANGDDPWKKTKSTSKIGRMVRQLLNDNKDKYFGLYSDADIEKFVNVFKSAWDRKNNKITRKVEVVKGDKILYWYNANNYLSTSGQLGNSCMRYPEVNDFMELYDKNPDKVSMVIVTEENKLVARALIWNLDYSSDGNKLYLDRVYTLYDNDVNFVHSWVLENLANNDKKILGTRGNSSIVKVNLKNVNFEKYPYCDTLKYLYQKNDGTGGYISNNLDKKEYDKYKVTELVTTNGSYIPISHKFSEKLNKWLLSDNAVYIDSVNSFMPVEDVVYCKYIDRSELKSDCVYSEKMKDWVPKSDSVVHPKYGIVYNGIFVEVISGYSGTFTDPFEIYYDIMENKNHLVYDEEFNFFRQPSTDLNLPSNKFSNDLKVTTIEGYRYVNFLCYKLYKTVNSDSVYSMPYGNYNYITELEAKFYGVEIIKDSMRYTYFLDYAHKHKHMIYSERLESINKITSKEDLKKQVIKNLNYMNDYLMKFSIEYKLMNGLNGMSNLDIIEMVYRTACDDFDTEEFIERLESVYYDSYNIKIDDNIIKPYLRFLKPCLYYYLIDRDISNSVDLSRKLLDYDMKGIISESKMIRVMRFTINDRFIYTCFEKTLKKLHFDIGDTDIHDIYYTITGNINPYITKFIDKI